MQQVQQQRTNPELGFEVLHSGCHNHVFDFEMDELCPCIPL